MVTPSNQRFSVSRGITFGLLQDHVTVTSLIVTEMASGGTAIVMKEAVTGIAMTTGTAETMMEVCLYMYCKLLLRHKIHITLTF